MSGFDDTQDGFEQERALQEGLPDESSQMEAEPSGGVSGEAFIPGEQEPAGGDRLMKISGMYENWFLDYASYVILERAVPDINDGFKPVQRRIIHSMRELEDGRYNKVANIVGNTMKYHPHGDASIKDAMVQLGQKELLIDTQGNWGNILTGDSAAAGRYIEARLSKFALDVIFTPKVTLWQTSYDGRNREPIHFPMKFPLLLAQGVEGIAVGLSTKILPHNFNELIDASILHLQGKSFEIYPDFPTAGVADVSGYNDGQRGSGRVRVRARIRQADKGTLIIEEIPFGTTTSSLIESVIKANDKGKIKIKKIEDNTAASVEIIIQLMPGISPDTTIDALYAFTDCEVSISPLACVIQDEKPVFPGVSDILRFSTDRTVGLLSEELRFKLGELEEQWHFSTLEKIFIEERIYKLFDNLTYEEAIALTHEKLKPFASKFIREITDADVQKLLEIRMRRITRHDADAADAFIASLEEQIAQIRHDLEFIIDYTIEYFRILKKKYGKGRERRTELRAFDNIEAVKVAVQNTKLYVDAAAGFVGNGLKKGEGEYVCDCSDIDDIIIFLKDGTYTVQKISQKSFVGKDIIHVGVWQKKDWRTVYNVVYRDGKNGYSFMKRFAVSAAARDKAYDLSQGKPGSEVLYFSANLNGEAEKISVHLRSSAIKIDVDFASLEIKGREAKGNLVTKYPVTKIEMMEKGISTLSARKIWLEEVVMRLNDEGRGRYLGEFKADDRILEITRGGRIRLLSYDLATHFNDDALIIEKWNPKCPVSAVYYDGEKKKHYVKRFMVEVNQKPDAFISEAKGTLLLFVSSDHLPQIEVSYAKEKGKETKEPETIDVASFIAVKGIKAQGNQLSSFKVKAVKELEPLLYLESPQEVASQENEPEAPEHDPQKEAYDEGQITMTF